MKLIIIKIKTAYRNPNMPGTALRTKLGIKQQTKQTPSSRRPESSEGVKATANRRKGSTARVPSGGGGRTAHRALEEGLAGCRWSHTEGCERSSEATRRAPAGADARERQRAARTGPRSEAVDAPPARVLLRQVRRKAGDGLGSRPGWAEP